MWTILFFGLVIGLSSAIAYFVYRKKQQEKQIHFLHHKLYQLNEKHDQLRYRVYGVEAAKISQPLLTIMKRAWTKPIDIAVYLDGSILDIGSLLESHTVQVQRQTMKVQSEWLFPALWYTIARVQSASDISKLALIPALKYITETL